MKLRIDVFSPFWYFTGWIGVYVPSMLLLMHLGWAKYEFSSFSDVWLAVYVTSFFVLSLYGFFGVFTGMKLSFPLIKRFGSRPFQGFGSIRTFRYLFGVLVVSFGYFVYLRVLGQDPVGLRPTDGIRVKHAMGTAPSLYVLMKQPLDMVLRSLLVVGLVRVVVSNNRNANSKVLSMIALVATIWIGLVTGSRGMVLSTVLVYAMVINYFKRTISLWVVAVLLAALFVFLGVLQSLRLGKDLESAVAALFVGAPTLVGGITRRFDSYFPNLFFFFGNREMFQARWGFDYAFVVGQWIPRSILGSDKPYTLVREFNTALRLQSSGGTGIAPVAEAWANGGLFLVGLHAFAAAFVWKFMDCLYRTGKRNHHEVVFYLIITTGFSLLNRVLISPGITHAVPEFVVAAVLNPVVYITVRRLVVAKTGVS